MLKTFIIFIYFLVNVDILWRGQIWCWPYQTRGCSLITLWCLIVIGLTVGISCAHRGTEYIISVNKILNLSNISISYAASILTLLLNVLSWCLWKSWTLQSLFHIWLILCLILAQDSIELLVRRKPLTTSFCLNYHCSARFCDKTILWNYTHVRTPTWVAVYILRSPMSKY